MAEYKYECVKVRIRDGIAPPGRPHQRLAHPLRDHTGRRSAPHRDLVNLHGPQRPGRRQLHQAEHGDEAQDRPAILADQFPG